MVVDEQDADGRIRRTAPGSGARSAIALPFRSRPRRTRAVGTPDRRREGRRDARSSPRTRRRRWPAPVSRAIHRPAERDDPCPRAWTGAVRSAPSPASESGRRGSRTHHVRVLPRRRRAARSRRRRRRSRPRRPRRSRAARRRSAPDTAVRVDDERRAGPAGPQRAVRCSRGEHPSPDGPARRPSVRPDHRRMTRSGPGSTARAGRRGASRSCGTRRTGGRGPGSSTRTTGPRAGTGSSTSKRPPSPPRGRASPRAPGVPSGTARDRSPPPSSRTARAARPAVALQRDRDRRGARVLDDVVERLLRDAEERPPRPPAGSRSTSSSASIAIGEPGPPLHGRAVGPERPHQALGSSRLAGPELEDEGPHLRERVALEVAERRRAVRGTADGSRSTSSSMLRRRRGSC